MKILVIEDDAKSGELVRSALATMGWEVLHVPNAEDAWTAIWSGGVDAVVSDVCLPGRSGIELAKAVAAGLPSPPPFILVSGDTESIETVSALEEGVEEFLPKPINLRRLAGILTRIERKSNLSASKQDPEYRESLRSADLLETASLPDPVSLLDHGEAPFIGVYGPKMLEVCRKLDKVAPYPDIAVLIEGETGTGKEVVARYISTMDQENEGPFVAVNCSLFNSEFFAAELFGYEQGAFTGASQKGKKGKIDHAANGCLFLDEITEMPADLQARFLRVLQERNFYRMGGERLVDVTCRFVFATNRDIRQMVADRHFREDLYYRLSLCVVRVPPLRERLEEIAPLAVRFLKSLGASRQLPRLVESAAFDLLESHDWPGNARELQHSISSWVIFESGSVLRASSLAQILGRPYPPVPSFAAPDSSTQAEVPIAPRKQSLEDFVIPDEPFNLFEFERAIVHLTLAKFGGNKARTAEFLGISRSQLYDKFK